MNNIVIREGRKEDISRVLDLVRELAEYEKAPLEVTNTEEMMLRDGFGPNPIYGLLVAESEGTIIGIAIHYVRYSTWKGPMLYLEDIVIQEQYRGKGVGSLLFESCVAYAQKKEYAGMAWQVLDWNTPAIQFYKKYNSVLDPQWVNGLLTVDQIRQITDQIRL